METRSASMSGYIACVILAGLVTIGDARGAAVIADSEADFSGSQGWLGWYYGYFTQAGDSASFTEMIYYISDSGTTSDPHWRVSTFFQPYTYLWDYGAHPDARTGTTVRRWQSTFSGNVLLTGHIADANVAGGNGVIANILLDGVPVFSWASSGTDDVGTNYSIPLTLAVGSVLDFEVADNGDYSFDTTYFTATVSTVPLPAGLALLAPATMLLAGMRRRDAAGRG
ncbi:MAG: hypothetical protein H6978_16380 [Gammaproteobacteria bacterium]|nr:hypothetical protein [Gammaproteobacteria bacterium]MCP5146389.1 hypothetical protein [Gammaproteobacteria bacterium]